MTNHPNRSRVVTYQTSCISDPHLDIAPAQERRMTSAGVWPKGRYGNAYTSVYHGLHTGRPTLSAVEIDRLCAGEHAIIDIIDRRPE